MSSTSGSEKNVNMSEEELQDLKEVFDLMDIDGSGELSMDEVKRLMDLLGMSSRVDELDVLMAEIDADGSGMVDFDEFVQVMSRSQDHPYARSDILRAFRIGCKEADVPEGHLKPDTLEKFLLQYCGDDASEDELLRLVGGLELNAAGQFNYAAAVQLFINK